MLYNSIMTEQGPERIEPRWQEYGEEHKYHECQVDLGDTEAVETSPFRQALEGLRDLGLTNINIARENVGDSEYPLYKWTVYGHKKIPGNEALTAEDFSGNLDIAVTITASGERELEFSFGEYNYENFDPDDLSELVWGYLMVIHGTLSKSRGGLGLPLEFGEEQ